MAVVESRLAEFRKRRGIAAAELARAAGVSRQTIYAMEAGDYIPNTAVALKLARLLESTVEELFRLEPDAPAAAPIRRAELIGGGDRFRGTPLELCRVGGRLVAVPAVPVPWHLAPADGLLVDPARGRVQLLCEETANRVLIAGCDPASSVLARHLDHAQTRLVSAPVNSSTALDLLKDGLVHVAGTHLQNPAGGDAPVAQFPKGRTAVFSFVIWEQGLAVGRGNPKRIRAVEHLARRGVRLANREKGSGSRQLLDARLKAAGIARRSVAGYNDTPAAGHLAAAWRVYAGLADCCVATGSAARAFGLDFIALSSERYDLVIRREHLDLAPVQRLLDTLCQAALRRELETLCAYDTRETGQRVA
ncbi:MAG: helix-turn-helix domain-containing protein [Candidatus Solibacter sp.]|nr:helix-turn-helix domain-containing protein [Candidatus Solibacter sp.]